MYQQTQGENWIRKGQCLHKLSIAFAVDRTSVKSRALYPRKIFNYQKGIHLPAALFKDFLIYESHKGYHT